MKSLTVSLAFLASTVSAAGQPGVPPLTLFPAYPPGHNPSDLVHLVPEIQKSLYYRENGKSEHLPGSFSHINSTFNHPAVLLDHSSHVKSVICSDSALHVCFDDDQSNRHAQRNWGATLGESNPLILSTNHPGCGGYGTGVRGYWKASYFETGPDDEDNNCVHVQANEVPLDDAMDRFELEFGQNYAPERKPLQRRQGSSAGALGRRRGRRGDAPIAPSGTVDITNDPDALTDFFAQSITETYPDVPEATPVLYNGTLNTAKRAVLSRRSFLDDLGNLVKRVKNVFVNGGKKIIQVGKTVLNKVVDLGRDIGKLIQNPLGYTWTLGTYSQNSFNLGGAGTFQHPTKTGLFGEGEGIAIDTNGVLPVDLSCENCYAHGDVGYGGQISASIRDGVKEGYLKLSGSWHSRLALAMKLEGQYTINLLEQELLAVNLIELQIPGFASIGPQVSISTDIDLEFDAEADILVGAQLDLDPSEAQVDFLDESNSHVSGFKPVLTPIAKFRGDPNVTATLALGFPLALEFGIDILDGKWKRTVGLVDKPSFAVTAAKSGEADCNGIQIGLSVENEIYAAAEAVKEYKYTIRSDTLWEHPLTCINIEGSSGLQARDSPQNDENNNGISDGIDNPRATVHRKFPDGGALTRSPRTHYAPANHDPIQPVTKFSYESILTDFTQRAVLFAGKEDRLYLGWYGHPDLVTGIQFASRPDVSESIIVGDVFGGYINYNPEEIRQTGVSNLRSSRLTNIPKGSKFIALAEIYNRESLQDRPTMYVGVDVVNEQIYALATCSVVNKGTRMYIVDVNSGGLERLNNNELAGSIVGGEVEGCQYVHLTSGRKGLELAE